MDKRSTSRRIRSWLLLATVFLAACDRPPAPPPTKVAEHVSKAETEAMENGAISTAPIAPAKSARAIGLPDKTDWSPTELTSGQAWISCQLDYEGQGDGEKLPSMDRKTLEAALQPCVERGLLRLRYQGRIDTDFAILVERVAKLASNLKIGKRVLDLDSAGGQVEDAIRAGDSIGESRWTLWVREHSKCHSACVLVLSGGDVRMLAGKIGIHRVIRMSSTATTRAELNVELRTVYDRIRDYLERNGTSTAVADLMKAVPNRNLRLLSNEELLRFGLEGINSAQDDLDRLRLQRECGEGFVSRRDGFARAFDRQCRAISEIHEQNACGLALRARFGFPDASCPAESPLSEFDLSQVEPPRPLEASAAAQAAASKDQAPPSPDEAISSSQEPAAESEASAPKSPAVP